MTEGKLQQDIFTAHWNRYPKERGLLIMFHNNPKNRVQGGILKRKGLIAGASDLVYLNPRTMRPMFIELKVGKNKQSEDQIQWEGLITAVGFDYYLAYTIEEFAEVIGLCLT